MKYTFSVFKHCFKQILKEQIVLTCLSIVFYIIFIISYLYLSAIHSKLKGEFALKRSANMPEIM